MTDGMAKEVGDGDTASCEGWQGVLWLWAGTSNRGITQYALVYRCTPSLRTNLAAYTYHVGRSAEPYLPSRVPGTLVAAGPRSMTLPKRFHHVGEPMYLPTTE